MTARAWIDAHVDGAPPVLRERALEYVQDGATPAAVLADAGERALGVVLAQTGDRGAALDLLAADGLITLALLAQAKADPARLESFAAELMRR